MAQLGVKAISSALQTLEAWDGQTEIGMPQDTKQASRAPRLKKQDGLIDWSQTAEQIFNQVRAFQPWPGSFSQWQGAQRKPLRVILHQVACVESSGGCPGEIVVAEPGQLVVQTGQGGLEILSLQPAGKREMEAEAFLRGYQPQTGDRFGAF